MKVSSDDKLPQMNEAIAFDTLRFAKYLAKNGFTEQQAETMAEAQVKFLNANLATLATGLATKPISPIWPPRPTSPVWPRRYGRKTGLAKVEAGTDSSRPQDRPRQG